MKVPRTNLNVQTMLYRFGAYVLAQLRTDPEAAAVLEIAEPAQQQLEDRVRDYNQAQTQTMGAQAARDRAARELGREIRAVAFTVKTRGNNSRSSPLFQKYFPNGFGRLATARLGKRVRAADILLEKLAGETVEVVAAHIAPLREARERLIVEVDSFEAAVTAERASYEMLLIEKREWIGAYRACHGMLTILFRNDKERVNSYFRSVYKQKPEAELEIETEIETDGEMTVAESGGGDSANSDDALVLGGGDGEGVAA